MWLAGMNRFANGCINFISGVAVVIGTLVVIWESFTMYYLITGRIQAGDEYPPLSAAAMLFAIGMVLLVAGFVARRLAARRNA